MRYISSLCRNDSIKTVAVFERRIWHSFFPDMRGWSPYRCTMGQNQVILRRQKSTFPRAREWAKWVSEKTIEWAVRTNERTEERVAQYLRLYACLFQTTVRCLFPLQYLGSTSLYVDTNLICPCVYRKAWMPKMANRQVVYTSRKILPLFFHRFFSNRIFFYRFFLSFPFFMFIFFSPCSFFYNNFIRFFKEILDERKKLV